MNVFYDLYKRANLRVNMRIIFTNQIWIIKHDSEIIHNYINFMYSFRLNAIILTSFIQRIIIFYNKRFWLKRLRKALLTDSLICVFIINHVRSNKIMSFTEFMTYLRLNDIC